MKFEEPRYLQKDPCIVGDTLFQWFRRAHTRYVYMFICMCARQNMNMWFRMLVLTRHFGELGWVLNLVHAPCLVFWVKCLVEFVQGEFLDRGLPFQPICLAWGSHAGVNKCESVGPASALVALRQHAKLKLP